MQAGNDSSTQCLGHGVCVFDRWFASVPASTQPNRFFIHSATSFGAMSNVREDLVQGLISRENHLRLYFKCWAFIWYLLPEHSCNTILSQPAQAEVCEQIP